MTRLTVYSRPGCHLCEDMKAVLTQVARSATEVVAIEEVDISTDPELMERYALEIPVLLVNGRKAAKYRVTEGELLAIIAGRSPRS